MYITILLLLLFFANANAITHYEVQVKIPECDYIIENSSDWVSINDPDKYVFCVKPAVYKYDDIGIVTLSRSGSLSKPRYLRWYDPENPNDTDTHIVNIPVEKQAVISQFNITGDYWIVDRIIIRNSVGVNMLDKGASHNILNRLLIEGGTSTLLLRFHNSHNNILQNSVLRNTVAIFGKDSYAIYFHKSEGERIVNNEIYNFGGGIQQSPLSLSNHVVYGNEFYINDDLYTDCNGNNQRYGLCACSEGFAVVLKGVNRPGSTFRIENNLIYGLKPHDKHCMGSGAPGTAIDLGSAANPTYNVVITGNTILNKIPNNIYLGQYVEDVEITNNIIGFADNGIVNVYGKNIKIAGNRYIDNLKNYQTGQSTVGTVYKDNSPFKESELCFQVQKFTNPHTTCIPLEK